MKDMIKKILSILCICICLLNGAACGKDPKTIDYNGRSYQELEAYAMGVWEAMYSMDLQQMQDTIEGIEELDEVDRLALMEANEGLEEQYLLAKSWIQVSKESGAFQSIDRFVVTKSGKNTTTELFLNFENRKVVVSVVYENRTMSVDTTTVDLVYSSVEKLQKAAMNTIMGMGTVFVMLIIICLIISCFGVIPKIEKKMAQKKEKKQGLEQAVQAIVERELASEEQNLELVAVIAAAIAASTGQSTDDFVVRSIKRR